MPALRADQVVSGRPIDSTGPPYRPCFHQIAVNGPLPGGIAGTGWGGRHGPMAQVPPGGSDIRAKTVTAQASKETAPRPWAQAGPAKTSRPTPAARLATA